MMIRHVLPAAAALLLATAACSPESRSDAPEPEASASATPEPAAPTGAPAAPMPRTDAGRVFPSGEWEMVSSGEGDGLFFGVTEGEPGRVHLFCPRDGGILVNVNAFRPVGSEERMSLGSGATVVALVADPAGDAERGGVSGKGAVPRELGDILTGISGVSVIYGAQTVGPLPPVPGATAGSFVSGCTD